MRLVCLSDIHGQLAKSIKIPSGDILIFSGDYVDSDKTATDTLNRVVSWLEQSDCKTILFTPGNHDRLFERDIHLARKILDEDYDKRIILLMDKAVTIDGINFYGSPYSPEFRNWAFMYRRGYEAKKKWEQIPPETNILFTHGPPYGKLDLTPEMQNVGCEQLRDRITQLPNLKAHIFGHIHDSYGRVKKDGVEYINASICNEAYKPINPIQILDI